MKITETKVRQFDIESPGLDRIKVILEDIAPGKGQITITCWGLAWTGYYGGMGEKKIHQHILTQGPDCMATRMSGLDQRQTLKRTQKQDHKYLVKIISAVQVAIAGVA